MSGASQPMQIRADLIGILRREMYVTREPICDDDELIADLGLDSANIAIGLVAIEQQLHVTLSHQDIIERPTFGALVTLVVEARSNAARLDHTGSHEPA